MVDLWNDNGKWLFYGTKKVVVDLWNEKGKRLFYGMKNVGGCCVA